MEKSVVTTDQFKKRLTDLCVRGSGNPLPSKYQDRQILLKSIVLLLDESHEYTEKELNEEIKNWLSHVATSLGSDHAAIRRAMVDDGHLMRDRSGARYLISDAEKLKVSFEPSIEDLDIRKIVNDGRAAIEKRRQEHKP